MSPRLPAWPEIASHPPAKAASWHPFRAIGYRGHPKCRRAGCLARNGCLWQRRWQVVTPHQTGVGRRAGPNLSSQGRESAWDGDKPPPSRCQMLSPGMQTRSDALAGQMGSRPADEIGAQARAFTAQLGDQRAEGHIA